MNTEIPTPRTDSFRIKQSRCQDDDFSNLLDMADFARTLERELAEAKSLADYRALGQQIVDALEQRDSLRTQLKKAQAEIARMTECNQASIICLVTWMQSKQPHPKDIETALKFCNQAIAAKE